MVNLKLPTATIARRLTCGPLVILAATFAFTSKAWAEPGFPLEIQNHLKLNYTPPCTFCHATPQGAGPVTTKFGQSMLGAGMTTNVATVGPALDTLNANHTDSDGDGMPDIQQIQAGLDPSTGMSQPNVPAERYGCGARVAATPVHFNGTAVGALSLIGLVVLARRWRRIDVKRQFEAGGSPKERRNSS